MKREHNWTVILVMAVWMLLLGGCASPPEVTEGQKASVASLSGYVGNVEGMLEEALRLYVAEAEAHANYRASVILRSLEGKDAGADVKLALDCEATRVAAIRHAHEQAAKARRQLAEVRLDLADSLALQGELAKYLAASGVDQASVAQVLEMVARITKDRFFKEAK